MLSFPAENWKHTVLHPNNTRFEYTFSTRIFLLNNNNISALSEIPAQNIITLEFSTGNGIPRYFAVCRGVVI